jgi:hypothetical protein
MIGEENTIESKNLGKLDRRKGRGFSCTSKVRGDG